MPSGPTELDVSTACKSDTCSGHCVNDSVDLFCGDVDVRHRLALSGQAGDGWQARYVYV